ncbi:hypothetical protein [Aquimarina algiphila]|uniref:hypothetical protein n=1 Tax=Aquimarina algiphila TaxID=2047982 RepID=UPI00249176B6|nr:hypothetical protein [Aquimarina algiphila]
MKLKFTLNIAFLLVCGMSFGQDFKNDFSSVKTIDTQIQEEQYSTDQIAMSDRLVVKTPIKKKDKRFYSKKEWRKIKKQLSRNKKRVSNTKNSIYTSRTIDTIYLNIPVNNNNNESRLSGW